ncbi:hypothetical protein HNY73_019589 [Argiope bruennichi]|uniref:Uncharacterized protein n=1 Tax=Argiope bruennichi TaxID=94029 RepID=A0A8T0E5J5_ARGBR|nr:hypothetical protein HNY73_019589 [Argiope bruennichi]
MMDGTVPLSETRPFSSVNRDRIGWLTGGEWTCNNGVTVFIKSERMGFEGRDEQPDVIRFVELLILKEMDFGLLGR